GEILDAEIKTFAFCYCGHLDAEAESFACFEAEAIVAILKGAAHGIGIDQTFVDDYGFQLCGAADVFFRGAGEGAGCGLLDKGDAVEGAGLFGLQALEEVSEDVAAGALFVEIEGEDEV